MTKYHHSHFPPIFLKGGISDRKICFTGAVLKTHIKIGIIKMEY